MPPATHFTEPVSPADGSAGHSNQNAEEDAPEPERTPTGNFEVQQISFERGGAPTEVEGMENARRVSGQVPQHRSEPPSFSFCALHTAGRKRPEGEELPAGQGLASRHKSPANARLQRQGPAHQQDKRTASKADKHKHCSCSETEARTRNIEEITRLATIAVTGKGQSREQADVKSV